MDAARQLAGELVVDNDSKNAASVRIAKWLAEADIAMETTNVASEVDVPLMKARAGIQDTARGRDRDLYASSADLTEGESRLKRHDAAGALPLLQQALAVREKLFIAPHPRLAEAQTLLATCDLELGKTEEARALAAAATAIDAHYPELNDQYRRPLRELQARLDAQSKSTSHLAARGRG
jgi:hypothetical protein